MMSRFNRTSSATFAMRFMGAALMLVAASTVGAAEKAAASDVLPLPRNGFACCNLHYEEDWISDGNYAGLPMLPAGTPITVVSLGRHKAHILINGNKMRLGHDYGRMQESLQAWIRKIVVDADPTPRINGYPAEIQAAIKEGKVMVGMTREQVIASIGAPLTSETPSLDTTVWRHWVSSFEEYQLRWGPDGTIAEVSGVDSVRDRMIHRPRN